MKSGSRILAVVSGPIRKDRKGTALILGIVARDGLIEGVLSRRIATDGTDSTRKITGMVSRSRFREQIRLIGINGIALAGLNVIDIDALERALKIRTAVVVRNRPRPKELIHALNRLREDTGMDVRSRIDIVKKQAAVKPILINGLHFQSKADAADLKRFSGDLSESLRLAHLIVRGIATGESKGRI